MVVDLIQRNYGLKNKMINLTKKLKEQQNKSVPAGRCLPERPPKRASIRDVLLRKEVNDMGNNLPKTCRTEFKDSDILYNFSLYISPDEGDWHGGRYKFIIDVPEEYNNVPPKVQCVTKIWHPNINEDGEVCLSILRQNSLDSMGWAPTRTLKDVVWGLNSLFSDLLNFEDPLNVEAADHHERDKLDFQRKVQDWVQKYAKIK